MTELTRSNTALAMKIDNQPDASQQANLEALVEKVLDPLREAWGRPITVNSGYRCPTLNKAVGGVGTSRHLRGMAADITTGSVADNRRLYELAQSLGLPFTQLIGRQYDFQWLHIDHDPECIKRQVL